MILYSHRLDERNPGDFWSSPHHYFDLGSKLVIDCLDTGLRGTEFQKYDYDLHIAGGGAIFSSLRWAKENEYVRKNAKSPAHVVWGAGINFKDGIIKSMKEYDLVGIRNYRKKYSKNWMFVPCVSCMHELFDKDYEVTQEFGAVLHFKRDPGDYGKLQAQGVKFIRNKPAKIKNVINYIGKCETIITNSYHGAYWAMLMNKRVITYIPKDTGPDNKLLTFEIDPIQYADGEFTWDLLKKPYNYDNLLERYRERNRVFYERVVNEYLSSNMS